MILQTLCLHSVAVEEKYSGSEIECGPELHPFRVQRIKQTAKVP